MGLPTDQMLETKKKKKSDLEDIAKDTIENEATRENECWKNEISTWEQWENSKKPNRHIIGVTEEEAKRGGRKIFE